ncbi:MCP four helix bundle domain-containing protein [Larkinella soli]|uniref:MCP four helix bundle domain-containing protein n=1 Tax=Larkinella soli TaxID=1770527 RepID=UPI000FFB55CA|nr:MCP four helix bundle domain-containing protein [Larkinella soli]
MKWSFIIQQKLIASLLLTGIMLLIILSTIISRSNIRDIDKSFSSIYSDRLVPATGIVYLSENLYDKRLLLEKHLLAGQGSSSADVRRQLRLHDQRIDSLVRAFEKTFLVAEESRSLREFKVWTRAYATLEQDILRLSDAGDPGAGNRLFDAESADVFRLAIGRLNDLTRIQSVVGSELVRESRSESSVFNLISLLQISVAVVIGAIVMGLIHNSKMINQDNRPYHFN